MTNFFKKKIPIELNGKRNTPAAKHKCFMGKTNLICKINLLISFGNALSKWLDDKSFHTLMPEVEGIMISRLLTAGRLSDVNGYKPLSSSKLFMIKSKIVLLPTNKFQIVFAITEFFGWSYCSIEGRCISI